MMVNIKLILLLTLVVCLPLSAAGVVRIVRADWVSDTPGIFRWVLSAGGGPASGGTVTLNASLGQPVVGPSSAGNIGLNAGYWVNAPVIETKTMIYLPVINK
jgi:hypothetical protein